MSNTDHILAIGDIHGMHNLIEKMEHDLWPKMPEGTRLVFIGDYVDRGPDVAGLLDQLIRIKQEHPETVFLKGNHELMLLDAYDGKNVEAFFWNGGKETLDSYGLNENEVSKIPAAHIEFLRGLELMHETEDYLFVHAGLRPGVPLNKQSIRDIMWIREDFFLSGYDFGKTIIFGHTPFHRPLVTDGLIGIDTGAVYGNKLTCLKLPEREFHYLS